MKIGRIKGGDARATDYVKRLLEYYPNYEYVGDGAYILRPIDDTLAIPFALSYVRHCGQ